MLIHSGTEIDVIWSNGKIDTYMIQDGAHKETPMMFKSLFYGSEVMECTDEFGKQYYQAKVTGEGEDGEYVAIATVQVGRYTKEQLTEAPHDAEVTY